jgi:surfactin synthase thioesterase subunit
VSFCYPGRLHRALESPISNLELLLDGVERSVAGRLDLPFAFFGHSFGALVAFELLRRLRRRHSREAVGLIVFGRAAPQLRLRHGYRHAWPDARLIAHLRELGGLPGAIAEDAQLLELVLPAVRADLRMHETHPYSPESPLQVPILALGGASDPEAAVDELDGWRWQTSAEFALVRYPGGHFCLHTHTAEVVERVARVIGGARWQAR